MNGISTVTYLIGYTGDTDPVLGFERFEGRIGGYEGTCVLQHIGHHEKGSVSARITVVPGMSTGELTPLRGAADLSLAGHSENGYELVLSYDIG